MKIYIAKFLSNSWMVHHNWFELSYHKTKVGAEKSIEKYKEELIKKHNEDILKYEELRVIHPEYEEGVKDLEEENIFEYCEWKIEEKELEE